MHQDGFRDLKLTYAVLVMDLASFNIGPKIQTRRVKDETGFAKTELFFPFELCCAPAQNLYHFQRYNPKGIRSFIAVGYVAAFDETNN